MATSTFVVGLAASVVAIGVGFAAMSSYLHYENMEEHQMKEGYILECNVSHRRLLPANATHGFTYRTLWLLVSLTALESHALDVGRGWLFSYGDLSGRLTGLRPAAYLHASARTRSRSVKEKLLDVLEEQGYARGLLGHAWMLTMPRYLGFEGINPLTTYYCYDVRGRLFAVVLEVSHVHKPACLIRTSA